MQLTGAEVMVKCLEEEGVSTIFGYPGGAILPFYNALRDVKNIKHVLTAHEQGAAHAADGYARAGPVLVDVAHDVQTSMMEYHASKLRELPVAMPQKELVAAAVAALNKAERPVMLVGGGVAISGAEYEAVHLCEKMHLPVASTLMGLGCISSYREQFLGMSGLHGHERANRAIANADVVLAVGTRFNDRVTGDRDKYSAHKTIIHIDIDPAELNKNIESSIDIAGDMRTILKMLDKGCKSHDIKAWWDTIMTWPSMDEDYGNNTAPLFIEALNPLLKGKDYFVATDVGQHQMFTAQHLKVEYARQLITSGGLGTMGFGLPAAMGAKFACPDKKVICISGDGGYKMTGSELFTLASNNVPVVSVVFNNSGLGMIRQLQTVQFNKRFMACECPGYVDFVKYAEAFGLEGEHVTTPEDFAAAVKRGLDKDHTYVIEVDINPKDMVIPMVAPGKGVDEFVQGLGE